MDKAQLQRLTQLIHTASTVNELDEILATLAALPQNPIVRNLEDRALDLRPALGGQALTCR